LPCAAVGDSVFALGTGFHHNPCCLYCCHHCSPTTAPSFAVQPSQHNTEKKKKEKARLGGCFQCVIVTPEGNLIIALFSTWN